MGIFTSLRVSMKITSLITELEGSLREVAMGIKCQISVFSCNKIYQSDPQVKENSLNEVNNKILSETSINLIHAKVSVIPNMPGEANKPLCSWLLGVVALKALFLQIRISQNESWCYVTGRLGTHVKRILLKHLENTFKHFHL